MILRIVQPPHSGGLIQHGLTRINSKQDNPIAPTADLLHFCQDLKQIISPGSRAESYLRPSTDSNSLYTTHRLEISRPIQVSENSITARCLQPPNLNRDSRPQYPASNLTATSHGLAKEIHHSTYYDDCHLRVVFGLFSPRHQGVTMRYKNRKRLFVAPVLIALVISFTAPIIGTAGAAPAQAASCTSYKYSRGGTGTCVKYIQQILNGASANGQSTCTRNGTKVRDATNYLTADGVWGSRTNDRVKRFQSSHCLSSDGVVGQKTWQSLCVVGRQSGYYLSGPGWYDKNNLGDRFRLAAYKASVYAGCNHGVSWPKLLKL